MTAEQLAQLREVAERATPGDWRRASTRFNGITATPFTLGGEEVMLASASEKRDAEFIAAFNPAVALALLDELERKDKRIDELEAISSAAEKLVRCKGRYHSEQNYRALAALFGVTTPDLPPLESEARTVTVKLPPVSFFDFKTGSAFASGAYVNLEAMNKALAAAGINLTVEG